MSFQIAQWLGIIPRVGDWEAKSRLILSTNAVVADCNNSQGDYGKEKHFPRDVSPGRQYPIFHLIQLERLCTFVCFSVCMGGRSVCLYPFAMQKKKLIQFSSLLDS